MNLDDLGSRSIRLLSAPALPRLKGLRCKPMDLSFPRCDDSAILAADHVRCWISLIDHDVGGVLLAWTATVMIRVSCRSLMPA